MLPSLRTPCLCYGLPVPMDSPCLNFSEYIAHSLIHRLMICNVMHSQGSQMLLESRTCWITGDIWIWSGLGWGPGNHREEFDLRGHSTAVSTSRSTYSLLLLNQDRTATGQQIILATPGTLQHYTSYVSWQRIDFGLFTCSYPLEQ